MEVSKYIKLKPEFTGEEFERAVMMELASRRNVPIDIMTAKFGTVESTEEEIVSCIAQADINYSCSVGYDREEKYLGDEVYYENGARKTRLVEKTRTVTDWKPYTGTAKNKVLIGVLADETDFDSAKRTDETFAKCISTRRKEYQENLESYEGNIVIDANTERLIEKVGLSNSFRQASVPGDKQKDARYSGKIEVASCNVYNITKYSITYEYSGKEYTGEAMSVGQYNGNLISPYALNDDERKNQVKKKRRPYLFGGLGLIVLGTVFCFFPGIVTSVFATLGFIGACVMFALYFLMKKKIEDKLIDNAQEEKIRQLEKKLAEKHLKPLTERERNSIMNFIAPIDIRANAEK